MCGADFQQTNPDVIVTIGKDLNAHLTHARTPDSHTRTLPLQLKVEVMCGADFQQTNPDVIVTIGKEHLAWWNIYPELQAVQMQCKADYDVSPAAGLGRGASTRFFQYAVNVSPGSPLLLQGKYLGLKCGTVTKHPRVFFGQTHPVTAGSGRRCESRFGSRFPFVLGPFNVFPCRKVLEQRHRQRSLRFTRLRT